MGHPSGSAFQVHPFRWFLLDARREKPMQTAIFFRVQDRVFSIQGLGVVVNTISVVLSALSTGLTPKVCCKKGLEFRM